MSSRRVVDCAEASTSLEAHEEYLRLLGLAIADTGSIPLVLYTDTHRGISNALAELLLYSGRAQPTLKPHLRAPQRSECGRIVVALRETQPTLWIFAAEHLHHTDVNLFANIAARADVDLWIVPQTPFRPATRQAIDNINVEHVALQDAITQLGRSPTRGSRQEPLLCEAALRVGAGLAASCGGHVDAGQCAVAAFPHALIAARATPTAVRNRLHELTMRLPADAKWCVYAAARDPFLFAERAVDATNLSTDAKRGLRLGSLSADADTLTVGSLSVEIPVPLRATLGGHRDIRLEEGSDLRRPLLIPHDDGRRTLWMSPPPS